MKLNSIDHWPYRRVPCDPFGFLATRGQVFLVSKTLNRPSRVLKWVEMGWNLAVFVPGNSRRFPVLHLEFWPPGGQFYFVSSTVKQPSRALLLVKVGWNLAILVPGHSRRFPVTNLNFWPPGVRVYFVSKTLEWLLGKFKGLIGNINQLGPSLACQPKAPTSECLLPSFKDFYIIHIMYMNRMHHVHDDPFIIAS